jgi:hypothetical protein
MIEIKELQEEVYQIISLQEQEVKVKLQEMK